MSKLSYPFLLFLLLLVGCDVDCTTSSEAYEVRVLPVNIQPTIAVGDTLFFIAFLDPREISSREPLNTNGKTMKFSFKIEAFTNTKKLTGATAAFDFVHDPAQLLAQDSVQMTVHLPLQIHGHEAQFGLVANRAGRFAINMHGETIYPGGENGLCKGVLRLYSSLIGVDSIGAHHFARDTIPYYPGWQLGIEVMP